MDAPLQHLLAKTPLLIRVMSLYAACVVSFYTLGQPAPDPAPAKASSIIVSEPTKSAETPAKQPVAVSGTPTRLTIGRLGIDLLVLPGQYEQLTNTWALTDHYVHHATLSVAPNNTSGSTFLYGHNAWSVLGKTFSLAKGDTLDLTTDNGHVFRYRYSGDITVDPRTTDVVTAPSATPRVILMTCEGTWNESRRLMYFEFVEVDKR